MRRVAGQILQGLVKQVGGFDLCFQSNGETSVNFRKRVI